MTEQEVFDAVWHHFVTEKNSPSLSPMPDRICRLRGPNGERCAVGIFIPDDEYCETLEGLGGVQAMLANLEDGAEGEDLLTEHTRANLNKNQELLAVLQLAHDGYAVSGAPGFHDKMERELRNIGADFGLEVPEA